MSSTAVRLADNEAYAEAMHAILSGEPCRGLVTQPTQLLPHVFIGSQSNAEDLSTMRSLGISHVLNCAGYKGPRPSPNASPYDGLGIDYYEFKVCSHSVYGTFQPAVTPPVAALRVSACYLRNACLYHYKTLLIHQNFSYGATLLKHIDIGTDYFECIDNCHSSNASCMRFAVISKFAETCHR